MPTSQTLGSIIQPAQQATEAPSQAANQTQQLAIQSSDSLMRGMQTGMQLAQTQQDVAQKQQQVAAMKEQLDTTKFNKAFSSMHTLATANPAIAKRMVPKLTEQFRQAGIPVDEGVLQTMASDDSFKNRWLSVSNGIDATDPQQKADFMQAMSDLGMADKGLAALEANSKTSRSLEAANNKNDAMIKAAQIRGGATVDAAQVRGGQMDKRLDSLDLRNASAQYNRQMAPAENGLMMATRSEHILDGVDSGELKSNKAIRSDLTSTLASLVNNGKPSTVYGQSHQEFDSAYSNVQDKLNFLQGKADSTIPADQLKQLTVDIKALKGMYANQHEMTYKGLRQSIAPNAAGKLDNRFNTMREGFGLPQSDFGQQPNGQAPANTQQAPAVKIDDKKYDTGTQQKIKAARAAGYSDAQIAQKLNGKVAGQ